MNIIIILSNYCYMNIKNIFITIIILWLFFTQLNKEEKMSNTDIKKIITEVYQADIQSIRNLSKLANDLTSSNKLKIPGGLHVDGPFNLLPKGTIVAFNGTNAPVGWAVCDGRTVNGYKTPDLRGRFIRMHTNGKVTGNYKNFPMNVKEYHIGKGYSQTNKVTYIAKQNFNEHGGSDFVKLDVKELPQHNHTMNHAGNHTHKYADAYFAEAWGNYSKYGNRLPGSNKGTDGDNKAFAVTNTTQASGNHVHKINNTGSGQSHNNTPPYYVLTWIVKVI